MAYASRSVMFPFAALICVSVTRSLPACDASDDIEFSKAVEVARKTNRPLVLAFIGTDWSISSLKLDREVFDQAAFSDNSKYNFLLCKIHFYQTQERSPEVVLQNQRLAEKYQIEQFPTSIVLSPQGVELGRIAYIPGGVEEFADAVNRLVFPERAKSN